VPGKRRDQRILIDSALGQAALEAADPEARLELKALAAQMSELVVRMNHTLHDTDLATLSETAAKTAGRRGSTRFEVDPDGRVVLVVSYGGPETPALSRDTFKPKAWNKREAIPEKKPSIAQLVESMMAEDLAALEADKYRPPPPPKGRGFIKTSPSVTPATPVELFDDDLSNLFERSPEAEAPKERRVLRRLTGGPSPDLTKKSPLIDMEKSEMSLSDILKSVTDSGE
jgi:hypothetical protein